MELRQREVADWPDAADPDNWPDIAVLPGRLIEALELLRAELALAKARGEPMTARLCAMRDGVQMARDALIELVRLSPLERWRLLHPYRAGTGSEPNGVCGNPECWGERVVDHSFPNKEIRELHHRRWGVLRP